MSDVHQEGSGRRRPHPRSMADPFLEFDLARELDQLHCEPEPASGQNAKTLVKYDDFRIVLIALRAHTCIPGHWTGGRISRCRPFGATSGCERLDGRSICQPVVCSRSTRTCLMTLEALEDSAFLLTIAWPGRESA